MALVCTACIPFTLVPQALDPTGTPATWPCGPVTWEVSGSPMFVTQVSDVIDELSAITARTFVRSPGGSIRVTEKWGDPSNRAFGWTETLYDGWRIVGASIIVNPAVPDGLRVATIRHELGHALGMAHSPDVGSIMYGPYFAVTDYGAGDRESLAYLASFCVA